MKNQITISQKSSGNYFIGTPSNSKQTLCLTTDSIDEILEFFKKNNHVFSGKLIKAEYSQSTTYYNFNERLKAEMWVKLGMTDDTNGRDIQKEINDEDALKSKVYFDEKMKERFDQVEICLNSEPVAILLEEKAIFHTASLGDTKMINAYRGCGKGTAYLVNNEVADENGNFLPKNAKVIAFHYGYDQPANAPSNAIAVKVELSCTQICFF